MDVSNKSFCLGFLMMESTLELLSFVELSFADSRISQLNRILMVVIKNRYLCIVVVANALAMHRGVFKFVFCFVYLSSEFFEFA